MNRLASLATTLVVAAISLAGTEYLLRLAGYHAYQPVAAAAVKVEPGGRISEADADLGYRNIPGHYVVTPPNVPPFSVTHDANSLRVTHRDEGNSRPAQVWFFGCSFTYGWGLNDQDTFAWKIRNASNDLEVVNFGVPGYGTLQGLIQFRHALQTGQRPKFVAVVYGSFHDERNASLRFRRKDMTPFLKLGPVAHPYARLRDGKLVTFMKPFEYKLWPLQDKLAMVELAENAYSRNEDVGVGSQDITKAILREFASLASAHSAAFAVFGILGNKRTREIVSYAKTIGIAADVSEDLNQAGAAIENDGHPSAATNDLYAQRMIAILRQNGLY